MQPFALKQHDRATSSVRELRTEELGAVNGACDPEGAVIVSGHADGTTSYDEPN